jgi:hypothetical protein
MGCFHSKSKADTEGDVRAPRRVKFEGDYRGSAPLPKNNMSSGHGKNKKFHKPEVSRVSQYPKNYESELLSWSREYNDKREQRTRKEEEDAKAPYNSLDMHKLRKENCKFRKGLREEHFAHHW